MSGYEMPPAEARVLPFRRPARAVRVRRRNPWLALLRHFGQALLLVGSPALLGLWLFSSPTFALAAVDLGEHRFVERGWVDRALAPLVGRNLLRLELSEVRARLADHPWVDEVTVEKRLPDRLRIDVIEKRPVALLRGAAGLSYLGEDGRPIAAYDPMRGPGDLLLITAPPSSPAGAPSELGEAFALERELAMVRPEWGRTLSEIELLGGGDFRIHLGALEYPLLVRAGTLAERFAALAPLLPELARRYERLAFIDLRFDRRIIFQPAPIERTGEWPKQNSTS